MTLQLIQFDAHLNEIAATKVGSVVTDGMFFLDFSRPLEHLRWCCVLNRWFGLTVALIVPLVHQGEHNGTLTVGIHRSDLNFAQLRTLWKSATHQKDLHQPR